MKYSKCLKAIATASIEETKKIIERRYGEAYAWWLMQELQKTDTDQDGKTSCTVLNMKKQSG